MPFNVPKIKQPVVLSILVQLLPVYIYYGCKLQYVRKLMCWEEDCAFSCYNQDCLWAL